MNKTEKTEEIKVLSEKMNKAKLAVVSSFSGLTVEKVTEFRKQLRLADAEMKVAKNTLYNLAAKDAPGAEVYKDLTGPNGVIFAYSDPLKVAKIVQGFASENASPVFQVKSVVFEGKAVGKAALKELADLPSKEVLVAQLLGVLQGPMRNFVGVLAAVPRNFVTVLAAIQKKKEEGGA